jgi:hypothetical protein
MLKIGYKNVDWIDMAQNKTQWQTLVITGMNEIYILMAVKMSMVIISVFILKMEAVCSSETLVSTYKSTSTTTQ